MPQVGDKVTYIASKVGTVFEISRVSNDGREVELHLPGTNMERFRVNPDELTFVERRVPARASQPAKPSFNAGELAQRIATVQHSAMEHLSGEITILKKFLKSKRVPEQVLDALDGLCHDTEKLWSAGIDTITTMLEK